MNTTIIQVPVSKSLRNQAMQAAQENGFSSLQDAIRVFLKQLASKTVGIYFGPKPIKLSVKNDLRYTKMLDEIESGKVKPKVAHSVEELMKQLHGKDN